MTESHLTNFHHFYKRKMLAASENISDYMEVSETEKVVLETADAQWEEPDDVLVERWNNAWTRKLGPVLGKYNRDTGYFEGNGILNITTAQARRILDVGYPDVTITTINPRMYVYGLPTLLPIRVNNSLYSAAACCNINTIRIVEYHIAANGKDPDTTPIPIANTRDFGYLSNISHVLGILDVAKDSATSHLYNGSKSFVTIWLKNICKNIDLSMSANLRFDCLKYMVDNAMVTTGLTITLHKYIYNKITDEENTDWHQILLDAAEKNITFTTP